MASIRKEVAIDADPEQVWAAVRDFGAVHERLAPGFVTDTRLDGRDRIVTFFNGIELRENLVEIDDEARRLVWTIVDGPYTHHNGSAQVFPGEEGGTSFVWVTDLLPDEMAEQTAAMMEQGIAAAKKALEA